MRQIGDVDLPVHGNVACRADFDLVLAGRKVGENDLGASTCFKQNPAGILVSDPRQRLLL